MLLDLRTAGKRGRDTWRELRADPVRRDLPVVVLTTSAAEHDVAGCDPLGARVTIGALVEGMRGVGLGSYCVERVAPSAARSCFRS